MAKCRDSSFIIQHSSFPIPYPLSPIPCRCGISLIEVLISIFILAIGLLGVAAIIPLGQIALWETAKADRSGACGRAALRQIQVRRMLDYTTWSPAVDPSSTTDTSPFAIDPLGLLKGLNTIIGPTMERRGLNFTTEQIENIFLLQDDLIFDTPKNSTERPNLISTGLTTEGNYSWFFTVFPATTEWLLPVGERRLFTVSVAVCYKRNFDPNSIGFPEGEHTAIVPAGTTGFPGMGIGGGTVVLASSSLPNSSKINVEENQWVMLYHIHFDLAGNPVPQLNRCNWYRVVGVGMDVAAPNGPTLSLVGPDWDPNLEATLVVVPGVIGVYTTTMELDNDLLR